MAHTLLVAGTASHVGKSTVAAGLCRALADAGVDVAPFKAQNMSNNARAVPRATEDGFGEVGVSQYVQARAARVHPTTDHNPVLLKPRGDGESQLVVDGEPVAHLAAGEYYDAHWDRARRAAREAHARLAAAHDVVVAEGAGSAAELNLHDRDLANVETVRFGAETGRCTVLLVADVDRGGAFAAVVGTLELLPDDVRDLVAGFLITKFRGDRSLLDPGLAAVADRTGVPALGVLPHDDPGLPEEDSVAVPPDGTVRGADDDVADERSVAVDVPRLPRVANYTDLGPLARTPGVRVRSRDLEAPVDGDAVVLSGTKNTVDDCLACRDAGLHERLAAFDGPVVGLCGGYQMLGEHIARADREGTGDRSVVPGFGLLPVATRFSASKTVDRVTRRVRGVGPLSGAEGQVSGYEIHAGRTLPTGPVALPFPAAGVAAGAASGRVLGTYLHGLFENETVREAFVDAVYAAADRARPERGADGRSADPADRAAALVGRADLRPLGAPFDALG
ncbi:MAG: cobyric acid synthase [Halobacteriaceae archaeon]